MKTRTLYARPTGPAHATVRDILAGSNITGSAAGKLDRRWLRFEKGCAHPAASAFRFMDELLAEELATHWNRLHSDDVPVKVNGAATGVGACGEYDCIRDRNEHESSRPESQPANGLAGLKFVCYSPGTLR
jgi:hypothetical protein